jgi:hypothetical protein
MKTRVTSRICAMLLLGLFATSCTAVAAASAQPRTGERDATSTAPLAECDRPDIVLGPAPATSVVSQATAETASGAAGIRGPADVALLATVTIGTETGHAATPTNALRDLMGAPIVSRPAWVFVFRHQTVKMPGGIAPIARRGTIPTPGPISVLATVIDAQTGTFLRGWGCGFGN